MHSKLSSTLTFEILHQVDVVRQTIIFNTADDMRKCLAAIALDLEATVLRHKNRLSLEYDSAQSAGVTQGLAGCCRVLQCCAVRSLVYDVVLSADVLQRAAVGCRVLQCVAVRCGALRCVAVRSLEYIAV